MDDKQLLQQLLTEEQTADGTETVELATEDQAILDRICGELSERPQLALPLLDWMIPDLTFAPSKVLTGPGSKRFIGKISFQHHAKGFSFIHSAEAHELFGIDVFLHSAQRGALQVGDEVDFAILLNKEGKPQAFDVSPAATGPLAMLQKGGKASGQKGEKGGKGGYVDDKAGKGWERLQKGGTNVQTFLGVLSERGGKTFGKGEHVAAGFGGQGGPSGGRKGGKHIASSAHVAAPAYAAAPWHQKGGPDRSTVPAAGYAGAQDRYTGVITANLPAKNFGFIKCDDTFAMYGKDLWTHRDQMGTFDVGDEISFSLVLNKDGMPQAINLEAPNSVESGFVPPSASAVALDRYAGVISANLPEKNFGFIKCDETFALYGKDLWTHRDQMGNFAIGDQVEFTLILNKDGKPQAIDLAAAGGAHVTGYQRPARMAAAATPVNKEELRRQNFTVTQEATTDQCIGTITAIMPAKGFGFLQCAETFELYGVDVWVHMAQLGDFGIGDTVGFTLTLGKGNKPQAIDLRAVSDAKRQRLM